MVKMGKSDILTVQVGPAPEQGTHKPLVDGSNRPVATGTNDTPSIGVMMVTNGPQARIVACARYVAGCPEVADG